jgi:hypothetical protein
VAGGIHAGMRHEHAIPNPNSVGRRTTVRGSRGEILLPDERDRLSRTGEVKRDSGQNSAIPGR